MPTNRIALVTGANQGMGKQVAEELVADGFAVYVVSRDLAGGEAAAKEIGRGATALQLDVTDAVSIADSGWTGRIGGQSRRSSGSPTRNALLSMNAATMNEPGPVRTPGERERVAGPFQAVQGDTSGTCVDWQAFHFWQADDPGFTKVSPCWTITAVSRRW